MEYKNQHYADLAKKLKDLPPEHPCSSYEWEELVRKLCLSADDTLHNRGAIELEFLKDKLNHHK